MPTGRTHGRVEINELMEKVEVMVEKNKDKSELASTHFYCKTDGESIMTLLIERYPAGQLIQV